MDDLVLEAVEAAEAYNSECIFSFLKNSEVQINFKLNKENRTITYQ